MTCLAHLKPCHCGRRYPHIYNHRYCDHPELGYAYLEKAMSKADPHIGYSILAHILAETRHKVVITTNFDNLVANALSIFTNTFPLVCGHESLVGFIKPRLRRPLVAKIHRDLLLAPKSTVEDTSHLPEAWEPPLKTLLATFTPVVIGYGGNDGSLMDFLDKLEPGEIVGGIYWCYWHGEEPSQRIKELVAKHKGRLIAIMGFDELMLQLSAELGIESQANQIEKQAEKRLQKYNEGWDELRKRLDSADETPEIKPVKDALLKTAEGDSNQWWAWQSRVAEEPALDRKEQLYLEGLEHCPSSSSLTGNFANFMRNVRKDYAVAERLYRKVLELDPSGANNTGNFASFMSDVRKEYDEAERLYRKALGLDPSDATHTGNFAIFMSDVRKEHDEAERLYRKALELDSSDTTNAGNFAEFLIITKKLGEAKKVTSQFWGLLVDDTQGYAAICCIFHYAVHCLEGSDNYSGLQRLKHLLEHDVHCETWCWDNLLEALSSTLSPETMDFCTALTKNIQGAPECPDLNTFPIWEKLEPVDPAAPWNMWE